MWVVKTRILTDGQIHETWCIDQQQALPAEAGTVLSQRRQWVWGNEVLAFVCFFTRSLHTIIESGIPLIDGLANISSKGHRYFDAISHDIVGMLLKGKTLSDALAHYDPIFSSHYLAILRAGEQSGQLEKVTNQLMAHTQWQWDNAQKTQQSIRYPLLLLSIITASGGIYFYYLVPAMASLLSEMNVALPWYSQTLFGVAENLHFMVIGLVGIAGLLMNATVRHYIVEILMRFKPISRWVSLKEKAVFFTYISLGYHAGVPILTILGDKKIQETIAPARPVFDSVNTGSQLTEALERHFELEKNMVLSISLAEQTGKLSDALNEASRRLNAEYQAHIDKITATLSPVAMTMMTFLLLWVVASIFLPIYQVVEGL